MLVNQVVRLDSRSVPEKGSGLVADDFYEITRYLELILRSIGAIKRLSYVGASFIGLLAFIGTANNVEGAINC